MNFLQSRPRCHTAISWRCRQGPLLHAALRVALAGGRRSPGVSSATFYNRFRGYLRLAGLPLSGVHLLRHTAAKLRRDVGESVESVSQFLDHSSLAVTTTYLRRLEGQRDAAWHGVANIIGVLAPRTVFPPRSFRGLVSRPSPASMSTFVDPPSGCRTALTSTRLQSVHTSRFNSPSAGGRLARSHSPHRHLRPRLLRRAA